MNSPAGRYRMTARADSVARTRTAVLDAAAALFWERLSASATLAEVAERAGTTVQTVLRHFGDRDGLLAAVVEREAETVRAERDPSQAGDLAGVVRLLVGHYERLGDRVAALVAESQRFPALAPLVEQGVAQHRAWCEQAFAPALGRRHGPARTRLLAQLVAVCDVGTWRLLRRQAGLSRPETERALLEILRPLLET